MEKIPIFNAAGEGVERLDEYNFNTEMYYSRTDLNNLFRIGTIQPTSFIEKMKRQGTPIPQKKHPTKRGPHGFRTLWKASDVIEAAKANGEAITEPHHTQQAREFDKKEARQKVYERHYEKLLQTLSADEFITSLTLERDHTHAPLISVERNGFLSEEEIVEQAKELTGISGVYFLCDDKNVVYVGQSINVYVRVKAHEHDPTKEFTSWAYMKVFQQDLNYIETLYIYLLRPRYNYGKDGKLYAPITWRSVMDRLQSKDSNGR